MTTCDAYASIPRAQLTYDYLHTNSTTHEFLFGALAELVDNARDAASKRIDIYSVPAESYRGKYMLCFLDDGDGMDPDEVSNVIKFGRSDKRIIDKNMIGQYGNGLKSGTMRIAKDMILFTKKDNKLSCLMISRTFHEREKINEILIPMPNWDAKTKRPLYRRQRDAEQHQTEVGIITKYSPFKTSESLLSEFDKIKSTGTLVILYNLQLMDNGQPELDVTTDPRDILMGDPYAGETYGDDKNSVVPERKSFRAYTAVLYLDPKMKIYIQNKKVRTVRLVTSLYKPATYTFTSKRFKCRLEREEKKAEQELKIAEAKAKELEMQDREEREKTESLGTSKDTIAAERQSGVRLAQARTDVNFKKMTYDNTKKALKEPQTLDFVFGINLNKRRCCGVMVYNCNRLIKMYEKVGCQTEGGVQGYGVMGIVNVPYLVLEPTHNKQDFADGKEYKALTKALGEHLDDYWKHCPISKQGVVKFWDAYGYNTSKWKEDPSVDERYVRKRMMDLPLYVQCDKCLKWRELAFHSRYVQKEPDEHWSCKMNPDSDCNNCQRPEKKPASTSRATLNKSRAHKTTPAPDTNRDSRTQATESRSQNSREATRGQPAPPPRTNKPVERAAERPIRPAPQSRSSVPQASPARTVAPQAPHSRTVNSQATPTRSVAHATTSSSARQKTQTSSAKRQERATPSPTTTASRQIKQEKSSQKRPVGRPPKADSTEQKRESTMKRPHPDNNNVEDVQEKSDAAKRRKSDAVPSPVAIEPEIDSNADMDWTNEREAEASGPSKSTPSKPTEPNDIIALQGRECEAKTHDGGWHVGTIVCVKQKGDGIFAKVKFRETPQDSFDKWYDYPGTSIRLELSSESTPSSPVSLPSPQPLPSSSSIELPSTTTTEAPRPPSLPSSPVASPDNTVSSLADREETVQDLAALARKLLAFYAPPEFRLTKDQLGCLSIQELRNFNTKEFCDKYEEDLGTWLDKVTVKAKTEERAVINTELQETKKQLSDVTQQLTSLRGKTCQLIGMLNDSSGENHIPENIEELESTLDNYITLLQNEAN